MPPVARRHRVQTDIMNSRAIAALIAATLAAQALPARAEQQCTVVINGSPLEIGEAFTDDAGTLFLSRRGLIHGLGLSVVEPDEGEPWTVRGFGRSLQIRPGSMTLTINNELSRADARPFLRDEELFVPLQMVQKILDIDYEVQQDGPAKIWLLSTVGAGIIDAREGRHGDSTRVVLDLERPAGFSWWVEDNTVLIELPLPAGRTHAHSIRLLNFEDELVDQLREGPTGSDTTRVEIVHSSQEPPRVFSITGPPRIIVDLMRAPEDIRMEPPEPPPVTPLPLAAGLFETRNFSTERGPVRVYVLNVDPRSSAIEIRPSLSSATIHERATVTRMVTGNGAWGGINGGFFCNSGPPLGGLMIDGTWIREPWDGRTVLGMLEDGGLVMDRLRFRSKVTFEGLGTQTLHALNRGHDNDNTLVKYTRHWGELVAGARGRARLVVGACGTVIHREFEGRVVQIPDGGFVLSGIGGMAESLRKVPEGCRVTPELATQPAWPDLRHAIGGGPRIVKDGRPHVTARPEGFRADVYAGAAPRTAVGITEEGRLLLVAAEGVENRRRLGMTLDELAATMIKLGVRDAMNLDGGGSTTFVADGRLINSPADGAARRVSNALLVFTRETETASTDAD